MQEIKSFIEKAKLQLSESCVSVFFSRRITANGDTKYSTHQPSVSGRVQSEILATIIPYIHTQLDTHKIVKYNPIGVLDGELEEIASTEIPMFSEFQNSLTQENLYREMGSLKIDKISFYCIRISIDGKSLYVFRQFQKLKRLRSGILTRIVDNELNVIDSDFLGIDEFTDMIEFEGNLYLLNHTSLERVFNYRDEFLRKTSEALGEILNKDVLSNIEQFTSDCCSDI